jgi:tetratricopeptide (TPR) repeat protein
MRRQSCEATRVRKEQSDAMLDLRAACLDGRLAEVRTFTQLMQQPKAADLQRAANVAGAIGDVTPCSDVAALARRMPFPADPTVRKEIDTLSDELNAAHFKGEAGDQAAVATLASLVDRARKTGFDPTLALALYYSGINEMHLQHPKEAAKLLEQAGFAAEAGGDDHLRFDIEVFLADVFGRGLERNEDARVHLERARAILPRLNNDPSYAARLADSLASVAWWQGRYDEAARECQKSIALHEKLDPNGSGMLQALETLAIVQGEQKQTDAALATATRALAIAEKTLGPNHPTVGNIVNTIGGDLAQQRHLDEAQKYLTRAHQIMVTLYGNESVQAAVTNQNLGFLLEDRKKYDDAIRVLRESLATLTKLLGPDHTRVGDVAEALGGAYSKAGHNAEAVESLQRAIRIHRERNGPTNPFTTYSMQNLGHHYVRAHQPAKAEKIFEETVAAIEKSQGDKSALLGMVLRGLGEARVMLGKRAPAQAAFERALSVLGDEPHNRQRAETEFDLATLLERTDPKRARSLAEAARARYVAQSESSADELAKVDAWLSKR